jgi:hypothetical protein
MCTVLLSDSHCLDLVRAISRNFPDGRLLVIGLSSQELERHCTEAKRETFVIRSPDDLTTKVRQGEAAGHFEIAVWFYPSRENNDDCMVEALAHCAANIVLTPGAGRDGARRRPPLVKCFERFGLLPDYECDLIELNPGAICLRHRPSLTAGAVTPAADAAFARLNAVLSALKRSLQIRASEMERPHSHIAALEEKLLKPKEYRREFEIAKRAQTNPAEIARAPLWAGITRAIPSAGETGENILEKAQSSNGKKSTLRCLNRIPEVVRAAARDCA